MKLGAVTKLDKRNKTTSKTFGQFFLFMDNLNRSRRRIPDVQSVKPFSLQELKTEIKLKN